MTGPDHHRAPLGAADTAVRECIAAFKRDLEIRVQTKVEQMVAGEITAAAALTARRR